MSVVNSFFQGQQFAQDQHDGRLRNKLAEQAASQSAESNALDNAERRQRLSREQATLVHAKLSQAVGSGNARQFVLQHIPDLAMNLRKNNIDLESMDDASANELIENLARKYGGEAGIAPPGQIQTQQVGGMTVLTQDGKYLNSAAVPRQYSVSQQPGPHGSTIVTDGDSFKVVERPKSDTPTTRAPAGYQFSPDGTLTPIPGGPADPKNKPTDFSRADKLRDEYNAASKDFVTIADNYAAMKQVASDVSAAGDLSLIFSYMKMLDPGSVVREQEFANAQNAGGVPDRIRASYNRVLRGERLSERQRADFINQAGNVFRSKKQRHDSTVKKRYTDMANRWQLNPEDVVNDLSMEDAPAAPAQPELTATGPNGQKLVLRGGKWVKP